MQSGYISSGFNVGKTDEKGFAVLTLPDEAGKTTAYLEVKNQVGRMGPVTIDRDEGFRPEAVKTVTKLEESGRPARFRLTDDAGRSAAIAGPIEAALSAGQLVISASFPEATPQSAGILTGTVLDQNGRPFADANVAVCFTSRQGASVISVRDENAVQTDARGQYVLRAIPRQSHEREQTKLCVIVYKDGYAGVDSKPFLFQPGDNGAQVRDPIRLKPGVSLSGSVIDAEGRPVVGATIHIAGGWSQGTRTYKTGPAGRFTVSNLDEGVVHVVFQFGTLVVSEYYVAGGKGEGLKVQLHPATAAKPVAAAAKTARRTTLTVGQPAPEWYVRGWTDGKARSLADFKGKVVFLEFWGIWCRGCVTSLPILDRIRQKFEPRGVVFLSIHTPGEAIDKIRKLFDLKKVSLVSALDEGEGDNTESGTTFRAYGVHGCPVTVLIDKMGKIAFRSNDPANRPAMEALVKKLGIGPNAPVTEETVNRLFEAAHSDVIEKALTRP